MPSSAIRIILATGNAHKAEEIGTLLRALGAPCEVLSAQTVGGMPDVDENADSFEGNALLKAQALLTKLKAGSTQPAQRCYVLADDSGLVVEALGGAPGIHSARYAGANATDAANNALLLHNLANVNDRRAAFVCCFALLHTDGTQTVFHGHCEGTIAPAASGAGGFGYDPLFIPEGYAQSFAELGSAVKNTISHRTRCCEQLAAFLKETV